MTALPCPHWYHYLPYGHVGAQEAPCRGLWQAIVARIQAQLLDIPLYQQDLDRWIVEIWDEQPEAKAAIAVNTTLTGREDEIA